MRNYVRLGRLKKLQDMLERHEEIFGKQIKFNMDNWCEKSLCGTTACALGSAASYQPFRKLGLKLETGILSRLHPVFEGSMGMEAGEAFFGISPEESEFLFDPDAYVKTYNNSIADEYERKPIKLTPKHVAKRVEYLIKNYEAA